MLAAGITLVWLAISFLGPVFFLVAGVLVAVGVVGAVLDAIVRVRHDKRWVEAHMKAAAEKRQQEKEYNVVF